VSLGVANTFVNRWKEIGCRAIPVFVRKSEVFDYRTVRRFAVFSRPEHNPDTCLENDRPNHSPIPRIS
jgi:hypothetical protein